jgi:hypothetical protein
MRLINVTHPGKEIGNSEQYASLSSGLLENGPEDQETNRWKDKITGEKQTIIRRTKSPKHGAG